MFVIVQSHINLEQNDPSWKKRPIDELVGETLKHAGVAITITSITDLLVFIVGASTVSFLCSFLWISEILNTKYFNTKY